MKDKLRELAERWRPYSPETEAMAAGILAILDAEGDGWAVDFPRYRATGFDAETNCAEMVADPDGAWVHVMDIPQANPARSGVVSDAADSGRVTPEMVDWLIAYQSRLIVNGLHPEDARLWMKSHEFKDFDYSASAVNEADAAWNDHFANPDDDGPVDFKLSQAFVDRVTRDESGEPLRVNRTAEAMMRPRLK